MDNEDSAMYLLESRLQDPRAEATDLPLSLLQKITNNFSDSLEIGRGGFGVVYKGKLSDGELVAVKKLSDTIAGDKSFRDEATSLARARHTNIVRLLGICAHTLEKNREYQGKLVLAEVRTRLMCLEYVSGSLHSCIEDGFRGVEWHQHYRIIMGICQGLRYLHDEQKIIHLDLKPQNILLDRNMVPKIADFGLSRIFRTEQTRTVTMNRPGTQGYMSPEYLNDGKITFKSDIYSLGVVLLQIITGTKSIPNRALPNIQNELEIWRNKLEKSLFKQVEVCAKIAIECTEDNPEDRPSTNGIIERLGKTESTNGFAETGLSCSTVLQGEMAAVELRGESSSEDTSQKRKPNLHSTSKRGSIIKTIIRDLTGGNTKKEL